MHRHRLVTGQLSEYPADRGSRATRIYGCTRAANTHRCTRGYSILRNWASDTLSSSTLRGEDCVRPRRNLPIYSLVFSVHGRGTYGAGRAWVMGMAGVENTFAKGGGSGTGPPLIHTSIQARFCGRIGLLNHQNHIILGRTCAKCAAGTYSIDSSNLVTAAFKER